MILSDDRSMARRASANSSVVISLGPLTFSWGTSFSIPFSRKRKFSYPPICSLNLNSFLIVPSTVTPWDSSFADRHEPFSTVQMSIVGIDIGRPSKDSCRSILFDTSTEPSSMRPFSVPMSYPTERSTKFLIRRSCKPWRSFKAWKRRSP